MCFHGIENYHLLLAKIYNIGIEGGNKKRQTTGKKGTYLIRV